MKQNIFKLAIFSRHPSHNALRKERIMLPISTSVRFGSTTIGERKYKLQLNKPDAVRISANKLLMKRKFTEVGVKTADWWMYQGGNFLAADAKNHMTFDTLPYPIIAKNVFGSRGRGNYKLDTPALLKAFVAGKDLTNYIFERYYDYVREYRLHVSATGCFYTCRKMLKGDTPKDQRWFRNDSNSTWILEENSMFEKPTTWLQIEADCVKALDAVGLDFAAFDVKVQSKDPQNWIIIESNSAPSFGDLTLQKYVEEIPKIVNNLINKNI